MTEQERLNNYVSKVLTERFGCTRGITTEAKEWLDNFKEGHQFGRPQWQPIATLDLTKEQNVLVGCSERGWVTRAVVWPEALEALALIGSQFTPDLWMPCPQVP